MEMEEVVRLLRGESGAGGAPLVVFQDSLGTVGGPALFATAGARVCRATATHRSACSHVLFCGSRDAERLLSAEACPMLAHVGAFSCAPKNAVVCTVLADGLKQAVAAAPQAKLCVILECLSAIILHCGRKQVMACLADLAAVCNVTSILALAHQDLHASSTMAALCRAAACVVQVRPLPEGPDQGRDGELYVQMKRSSGRVTVRTELFILQPDGCAACLPSSAAQLETLLPGKPGIQPAVLLMEDLAGGMRTFLTEEEKAARGRVALPFEPASLGEIHYLRDSASEHDSDEDPDDDLDI